VIRRINRKLAQGLKLYKYRVGHAPPDAGEYYMIVMDGTGDIIATHQDPEKLGRALGVLQDDGQVE